MTIKWLHLAKNIYIYQQQFVIILNAAKYTDDVRFHEEGQDRAPSMFNFQNTEATEAPKV